MSHLMTKPTKWLCAQRRLWLAWASAQSNQSSLCAQWVAKLSSCRQRRLWSDWADAQADLSLRWAHMPFCWFCHEVAQMITRICFSVILSSLTEPRYDKTNKMSMRPAKTQISLGICPVWSESSLCAQWVAKDSRFLHADSKDSDQTGRMPRLIWVFAGCTIILLVLSRCGSAYLHSLYEAIQEKRVVWKSFI